MNDLEILDPRIPAPPTAASPAALYLRIRNVGDQADTLAAIEAPFAARAAVHGTDTAGRMVGRAATIPPGETLDLVPGGLHGMLEDLSRRLEEGDTVRITLRFRRAGAVTVPVPIVGYADLLETGR